MPTKNAVNGKPYEVDGKSLTWTTDNDDTVVLPMKIKLGVIRKLAGKEMDAGVMFEIIDAIAPGQAPVLDEQDVNDFTTMFTTWQTEYNALTGVTPGE